MTGDPVLDERGRRCPQPVIALMRAAARTPGQVVIVLADDPAAEYDIPAWCRLKGAELLGRTSPDDAGPGAAYRVRLPSVGQSVAH